MDKEQQLTKCYFLARQLLFFFCTDFIVYEGRRCGSMPDKITMNNRGEKTVREAYDLFIRSRLVMNVSDDTIRFYNVSCKWFLEYVGDDELCKNITSNTITDYMFHLKETKPNLSSKSFSTYIRALRAVLNYTIAQKRTFVNIIRTLFLFRRIAQKQPSSYRRRLSFLMLPAP